MSPSDLSAYIGHRFRNVREEAWQHRALRPYLNRLMTRLIVTNKTDAHLAPDAPKDVAVYYYLAGAPDEQLSFWRLAIIENWMMAIQDGCDDRPLFGTRHGILRMHSPIKLDLKYSTLAERDQLFEQGYNTVYPQPGMGPMLWGSIVWRNGAPVRPFYGGTRPRDDYKHLATPLALLE